MLLLAAICAIFLKAGPRHQKVVSADGLDIVLDDAVDAKEVEALNSGDKDES